MADIDPGDRLGDDDARSLKETVAAWQMPQGHGSVRPWQARIGRPGRTRRGRWPRQLAGALGAALSLTVVAAIAAALFVARPAPPAVPGATAGAGVAAGSASARPPRQSTPGSIASSPSNGAPEASASNPPASTGATPLPSVALSGAPISPRTLLLAGEPSRLLSLPSGRVTELAGTTASGVVTVLSLPDGSYLCACASTTSEPDQYIEQVTVQRYDAQGAPQGSFLAGPYVGVIGPPDVANNQAATSAAVSPDGHRLLLGYTTLTAAGWTTGLDVYDIATGARVQRVSLSTAPLLGPGGRASQLAWPPNVTVAPDGRHLVIEAAVATSSAVLAESWWGATFGAGQVAGLTPFASGPGTLGANDCLGYDAGEFGAASIYLRVCTDGSRAWLRRVDLAGRPLGDTPLPNDFAASGPPSATIVNPASATWFDWDPFSGRLLAVDLTTGRILRTVVISKPSANLDDPVAGLVRGFAAWLAPNALAKTDLSPAIALSPDGTRLYLIGTTATSFTSIGGSVGVLVVDAHTLDLVTRWAPTADFDSIAVSRDGSLVYALGTAGVDASGAPSDSQNSLTVYDASNGRPRLVDGALGWDYTGFIEPLQP